MQSSKQRENFLTKSILPASKQFFHQTKIVTKVPPLFCEITEYKKAKYHQDWYQKTIGENNPLNIVYAELEVVAQEFFRLFYPPQPKTRLSLSEKNVFVLSKGIPNFQSLGDWLPFQLGPKLRDRTFTGLGDILVLSLLMNEVDLKPRNIGYNALGQLIKIDGDWCFARLKDLKYRKKDFTITNEILKNLPAPGSYPAFNWIDHIRESIAVTSFLGFNRDDFTAFNDEVNATILRVITVPDTLIKTFVSHYTPDRSITDEILNRIAELRKAALMNEHFQRYVVTSAAKKDLESYLIYIKQFRTTEKNYIFTNPLMQKDILDDLIRLREIVSAQKKCLSSLQFFTSANLNPGSEEKPQATKKPAV